MSAAKNITANISFHQVAELNAADLGDLCTATQDAITRGGGFGWLNVPPRPKLESYWQGLMLVPGRDLMIARLDGVIAGALQLHESPRNMESQAAIGYLQSGFTASWARGHGIGRGLMAFAIDSARAKQMQALKLDVRATQETAIRIYKDLGFQHWGTMPRYAQVDGQWVDGHYFYLDL